MTGSVALAAFSALPIKESTYIHTVIESISSEHWPFWPVLSENIARLVIAQERTHNDL